MNLKDFEKLYKEVLDREIEELLIAFPKGDGLKLEAITYKGGKPDVVPNQLGERIIALMEAQLEVLKLISTTQIMIPAGTQLIKTEVPE